MGGNGGRSGGGAWQSWLEFGFIAHRFPIALQATVMGFAVAVLLKFLSALLAGVAFLRWCILFQFCSSARSRTIHLSHSVRNELFAANRALFVGMNPIPVFVAVALQAKCLPVVDIVSKFWVFGVWLNVVRLQDAAAFSALLAGVIVALDYGEPPFSVLGALPVDIARAGSGVFLPLVVGFLVTLFHGLLVCVAAILGSKPLFAGLGYFSAALRVRVGALGTAITLLCSFCREYFVAVRASADHVVAPNKIPCFRRWLLLSRQLAPMRKQGIWNNFTPTLMVLQAA